MKEYQGFAISNFRTGFDESVEPWLLPRDAYQKLVNAHLYRGVLQKIAGYTLYAKMSTRNIMSLGTPDGVTKTFTINIPSTPTTSNFFAYGTIVVGTSAETFMYNGDASSTVINLIGSAGGTGTVNLSTLVVTITFNTAPPLSTFSSIFFIWDSVPAMVTAIMGIKPYYNPNGSQEILVFDQLHVGKIVPIFGVLAMTADANQGISEIPSAYYESAKITGDGTTTTFTGTLAGHPLVPGTVTFFQFDQDGLPVNTTINGAFVPENVIDNGMGGLKGTNPGLTATGSINYVTGAYTITFGTPPVLNNYFDSSEGVFGDLFTGSISNFFTVYNYQGKAFFTNSVDPIFYYDGNLIQYLNTNLEPKNVSVSVGVPIYDITQTLHLTVNRERLILLSPTVESQPQLNAAFWSVAGNPLDFINDEQLYAPTSQPIRTFGYINTDLIVRFANSERILRYTEDAFSPFRWDSTNVVWACDAPYSAISYDKWFSSVGRPAIVGSDGVNVKRVDEIIPDFTDPTVLAQQVPVPYMSQTSIKQCYGERFDDIKEGWLCYNSSPQDESEPTASDNVLAFNYLDQTYAIYQFPFSCLGKGTIINVPTWGTIFTTWQDMEITWGSYDIQQNALIDLGGDQFDTVFKLNSGNTLGDGETPVLMDVITKNFNPFIEEGQLSRLGYVDLFVSAYNTSTMRVQFYANDQLYIDGSGNPAGFYQETMLRFNTMDAMSVTKNQTKVWKRIYVGAVAKEHTLRFYQNDADFGTNLEQPIFIHAMVLYFKPAGRIFN